MSASGSFRGPARPGASPHVAARTRHRSGLTVLAAATATAATAASVGPAAVTAALRHWPTPSTLPNQQPHQQPPGFTLPPLASASSTNPPSLVELLGPSLAQAAMQGLNAAGAALQRWLDGHLAALRSGGCPASSWVLRAHWYAAGLQLATLGLATRYLKLDRAAVAGGQVWRLATWGLAHAGPLHFLANYSALERLGPQLEQVAGSDRFAAVYVAASAAAAVASLALNGGRPSLGSSGAVFGVAAALWRFHRAHGELLPAEAEAALAGLAERTMQVTVAYHVLLWSRLDWGAHIGGALGGWVAAALLGPDYRAERVAGGGRSLLEAVGLGARLGPPAVRFRDRPRWPRYADPGPRPRIPFPLLGPVYSVSAAEVGVGAGSWAGRGGAASGR